MTLTTLEYKHLEFPSFLSATNSFYKYLFTWFPTNSTKFNKFIMIHINSLTSRAPAAKRPYQDYEARSASPKKNQDDKAKLCWRREAPKPHARAPLRGGISLRSIYYALASLELFCVSLRSIWFTRRVSRSAFFRLGASRLALLCQVTKIIFISNIDLGLGLAIILGSKMPEKITFTLHYTTVFL